MKPILFFALLPALLPISLFAETPEEKGLAIAVESDRRDNDFGDSVADLTMILKNPQGNESVRHIRRKILEVPGDGDKSIDIFDEPQDVKGTALLTFSHGLEPDDQWIYLPALKRVKRISSVNKSGPFMGSEFAYEDLVSPEVEKYTYKYLGEEVFDGHDCFIVESTPAYQHSGYSRLVEWMDKSIYQPRKTVYYDRKNALLKTLLFKDYRPYLGQYWRAHEMTMDNHQTGKTTQILWKNYRFRAGLTEQEFSQGALSRVY